MIMRNNASLDLPPSFYVVFSNQAKKITMPEKCIRGAKATGVVLVKSKFRVSVV